MSEGERVTCRSIAPTGQLCNRNRGHKYSDSSSNQKFLHRDDRGLFWHGGTNNHVAAFLPSPAEEHYSDADLDTWAKWAPHE